MDTPAKLLLGSLMQPRAYPHPVTSVTLVETHISWVLLTGEFVYKLKKPVDFGFLDFSSLEKRKYCCEQELRLNRRLAPDIYLGVVAIRGTPGRAYIEGASNDNGGDNGGDSEGEILEYAVRMRQFDPETQFDRLLRDGRLHTRYIDQLAARVAAFHAEAAVATPDDTYGVPEHIQEPVLENITQALARTEAREDHRKLSELRGWCINRFADDYPRFEQRKKGGFIRECHGDLHLRNIALDGDKVIAFDCIEFNPNLRWIDVMSEVAFLCMDLDDRERADLGWRFLDRYLQAGGDYEGLALFTYYRVYRAMVRAKVAALQLPQARINQGDDTRRAELLREYRDYIELALRYTRAPRPWLLITHGLSGCGKTTLSDGLLENLGAIRLRSDVERKRLFGLDALSDSRSATGTGIYGRDAGKRTYARLAELARRVSQAGLPVIVDATFLRTSDRRAFIELARQLDVRLVILSLEADENILRQRILARASEGRDASEANLAVLERQIEARQPLAASEQAFELRVNGAAGFDIAALSERIQERVLS